MKELEKKLKQFNQDRDWDQFHSPENLAKSIAIESGELLECFQWSGDYDLDKVKDELADVVMYALIMSYKLGVDLEEIVDEKIERNMQRYPISKAKGNSKKYTEFE